MEQSIDGRVEYGLHTPIPGGSTYDIVWDDEVITINLPPVGFTIDRFPDPKTGVPTFEIVPCEVLFTDKPIEDQKWVREPLPKDWAKWRREEKKNQRTDPFYTHHEAEKFRQRHWTRRVNGCWIAIGNRQGKPTEYYYLPGPYHHFLNWWKQDFGYPNFRIPQWELYLGLQWGYDHPLVNGLTYSSNRRGGKTSISMHHLVELPTREPNIKCGMQAQTREDAKNKFTESLVYGFLSQPDFFKPKYDTSQQFKKEVMLSKRLSKEDIDTVDFDVTQSGLFSRIDFRETKATSYDGYKMHRYSFEEPGKWEEADIYKTLRTIVPCTMDSNKKIGFIFAPTTIEDMEKGGKQFIKMFEDSRPSLMKKNKSGKTTSRLVGIYLPAYRNYIFDEYGRPVVEDPLPDEIVYDEDGKRITKGAKTSLMDDRDDVRHDHQQWVELVRKYSFTWEEAKMMDTSASPFNVMILEKRHNQLMGMRGLPFIKGNFDWVDKIDGDVEFNRDDTAGRWAVHLNPDKYGDYFEGDNRITNRVGFERYQGKKFWFPKNGKLWRMGTDPIRYNKTDDPRASKAGAHLWYKFDPAKDLNKPISEWISHNFIAQYLMRPEEFEIYGEDMIKACRYYGCPILPEPNVTNLQQHFDARGYGRFILYRKDFDETVIPKKLNQSDDYKGLDSNDLIVDAYVSKLISFINKHGHRLLFPDLIQQYINFRIKDRTKFDGVVSSGYSILAGDATIEDFIEEETDDQVDWFSLYDSDSGHAVESVDDGELTDFFD